MGHYAASAYPIGYARLNWYWYEVMESESKKGWAMDSWSALQSAATLLMMAVAGLVWGLKLESRIDLIASMYTRDTEKLGSKVQSLETTMQRGVLPVTEVRLESLEEQIDDLRKIIEDCNRARR